MTNPDPNHLTPDEEIAADLARVTPETLTREELELALAATLKYPDEERLEKAGAVLDEIVRQERYGELVARISEPLRLVLREIRKEVQDVGDRPGNHALPLEIQQLAVAVYRLISTPQTIDPQKRTVWQETVVASE